MRFTPENTPGASAEALEGLNKRFDAAASRLDHTHQIEERFLANLEAVIREDWETQHKIANAFTTYQAKGNREDLA